MNEREDWKLKIRFKILRFPASFETGLSVVNVFFLGYSKLSVGVGF